MSFDDQEIQLQIFSPNLQNPLTDPLFVTVGNGIEIFSSDFNVIRGNLVEHSFDISSDSVFYEVSSSAGSGNFGAGNFNGYVISDVFDVLPEIENVTIDISETTLGINSGDISFNEDQIFFNVESLPFRPGDTVKLNVDFASQVGGVIRGTKWNDRNGNGSRNNNDPGLSGVQIYLDTNNNGILDANEPVTVTDQSGNYEFTGLEAGTYIVREVIPQGFRQTFPLGSETNSVGDGFADIVLDFFDSGTGILSGAHGGTSPNFNTLPNNIVSVDTDVVLGDDNDGVDFLVLPEGSSITVGFTDETIIDQPGNDLFITEFFPRDEQAEVFVSSDSTNFEFLGIADGGTTTALDLSDIDFNQPVQAIRIVALNQGTGTPGFELANVRVLENSIASSDFYTIEISENEVVENIDFGNFRNPTSTEIPNEPNNRGRSKGDPHLTTFDGVAYDFQGAGEFTLVESNNGDINVQIRYVPINSRVSVANAVATEVEGRTVVIDSQGIQFDNNGNPFVTRSTSGGTATVTIDGVEVELDGGSSIAVGNSRIYRTNGNKYTVVFAGDDGIVNNSDDQLVVNYLRPGTINIVDVFLGNEYRDQLTGLLGNFNNNPNDDVALPNGEVLPRPLPFEQLYGEYADAYRVQNTSESLFNYAAGQNPNTFYNPNFPGSSFTYNDLTPEERERGDAAATAAGYTPGTFEFESAAFDFAVTNDPGFLEGVESDPEVVEEVTTVITSQGFAGSEVQIQTFYPNLQTSLGEASIAIVGDGIEFSSPAYDATPNDNNDDLTPGYSIDITENSIIYETTDASLDTYSFASGNFNGFVFSDVSGTIPAIQNVTIDPFANTLGLDSSDITFTEDTIGLNVEGISYSPGDLVRLDVSFAPQPTDFTGSEIQLQYLFPDLNTPYGDAATATVGDGVEFSLASYDPTPNDGDDGFFSGYNIDITGNSITYEALPSPTNSPSSDYNDADFNGIVFTDVFDTFPTIENVTIDTSVTNFGIDASDITFTENSIAIDFAGISYTPGETFKLDVTFDV